MAGFRDKVIAAIHTNCVEVELKALLILMVDCEEKYVHLDGKRGFRGCDRY